MFHKAIAARPIRFFTTSATAALNVTCCPLGGPGASLLRDSALARVGAAHDCSAAAVALAWTIRSGNVIAIPESGSVAHAKENAVAFSLKLTAQEIETLDERHALPGR